MTMNVLDVFEYFESAPVADAERAIKYASRIVTARVGLPHKHATKPREREWSNAWWAGKT